MGAIIATIFTVIVVAISSVVITNPNINFDNRSKAMMTEGGGGNIPKVTPKPTGIANAQIGATPSTKPTSTTPSCNCVGGYLQNCGAGSGSPCSANTTPTSTPKPTAGSANAQIGDQSIPSPTSSGADLLAEKKECQMNGGAWTNNKCVYPTSTASLPKPTTSSDSCGGGMVCSSKSGTTCINGGGEPTSCHNSSGATGNCCSPINQPTTTPTTTPTTSPTVTPTCVKEGGTYKDGVPCCSPLVKVVTPYGAYCGKKGECTPGAKKCQVGGNNTYFEYLCDSSGYFQQNKRCDFGCSNNSCSTGGCTVGQTRCDPSRPNELETCTGTAWSGKSCDNGCETVSSTKAQCKTLSCTNPAGTPGVTQICNNAGGYNYCSSDGKWYSRKCEAEKPGSVCVGGQCVLPTGCTNPTAANGGTVCTDTGKSYNVCNNGSWFNVKCNTGEVCSNGKCVAGALKADGASCSSPGECSSGYCYNELEVTGQLDLIGEGNKCHSLSSSDTVQKYFSDQVDVAKEIAPLYVAGALAVPAAEVANVIDDFSTISQCALTQDPSICQWALVTVANPVPVTSLVKNAVEEGENAIKYADDVAEITGNIGGVSQVSTSNNFFTSIIDKLKGPVKLKKYNDYSSFGQQEFAMFGAAQQDALMELKTKTVGDLDFIEKYYGTSVAGGSTASIQKYWVQNNMQSGNNITKPGGWFDAVSNTIVLGSEQELAAGYHEYTHAYRYGTGVTGNIWKNYASQVNVPYESQANIQGALEEIGTISKQLELYDSIPNLPSGYRRAAENYMQYNVQLYVDELSQPNTPEIAAYLEELKLTDPETYFMLTDK